MFIWIILILFGIGCIGFGAFFAISEYKNYKESLEE